MRNRARQTCSLNWIKQLGDKVWSPIPGHYELKDGTFRRVLAVDLSGPQSDRNRHWMHWHSRRQLMQELSPHGLSFRCVLLLPMP
jgi:hypothetical protein